MPSYLTSAASAAGQLSPTIRMIPDVSIVADNLYQFMAFAFTSSFGSATIPPGDAQVFSAGGECTQGTSASAPLWAGVALLANQQQAAVSEPPLGFVNATLYALASASQASYGNFNDVTSGNNTYQGSGQAGFTAVTGYDLASGLGSPNGKSCSPLNVIPPQSCMAGNSLSALIMGANVTAFLPNGSYSEVTSPGISVVAIEGTGPTVQISTPGIVNTCGGNSQTGEVVCTANDLDIYLINGLVNPPVITNTLASGASATPDEVSGGFCQTCNVAIDPLHNKAYVSVSTGTDPVPGAAFQPLDLATGTLGTPIPANAQSATAEGILFDGLRGFVLSPNEGEQSQPNEPGDYQLLNTATGQVFDLINPLGAPGAVFGTVPPDVCDEGAVFDSAAEDCTTGIALSTLEFSDQLFLIDLTRATFNTASSTWSAPNGYFVIPEFQMYLCNGNGAGTNGISIAPRTHLGIVAGEFGGHDFAAIQLPATAGGSGTAPPTLVDYAFSLLPATPDGNPWQAGRDPHTLTTYTSPTNGRSYAIMEDDFFQDGTRTYLAIVDLNAMLDPSVSARGGASPHTVATLSVCGGPGPNPTGTTPPSVPQCTVRYIPIGPVSVGPSGGTTLPTLPP
jgi:hypothetical protein